MHSHAFQSYLSDAHVSWLETGRPQPGAERGDGACLLVDVVGFTAITENLALEGERGAERLSEVLNHTIGSIVDLVDQHGGDVVTFAGDAILAVWEADERPLGDAVLLASHVARAVHTLDPHPTVPLRLRASVGAGSLTSFEVGGVDGRWMLVTGGAPVTEVAMADGSCRAGEVVLSPAAWAAVEHRCTGTARGSVGVLLESIDVPVQAPGLRLLTTTDHDLQPYVPNVVGARAHQESFLAEFRRLSILFVNLTGLDGSDLQALDALHAAAIVCQEEVKRTGGAVYNFISDDKGTTFMATWGLPGSAHEDDAVRALAAALGIRERLNLRSGVGIATGRLFCGAYGGRRRRHYTIIGPTINLAARLMLAADGDGLLCDGRTRTTTGERAEFEALAPISAKGIADPVPVHRPVRLLRRQQATRDGVIGRSGERARFEAALDAVTDGQGSTLLLVGEAGIGKSQLVRHLASQAAERGVRVHQGAGESIESTTTWFMWRDVLSSLLGGEPGARAVQLLGPDHRLADWTPLLADVLPVSLPPNDTTAAMNGPARAEGVAELLGAILSAASGEQPLVLLVEDAHWLDTASWAGLAAVAVAASKLLVVVASRPLDEPVPAAWTTLSDLGETITLDVLSPPEAAELACRKLGVADLPAPVRDLLARQANGHPLYTEELAWALVEEGALRCAEGRAELLIDADALRQLALPDSLEGVITGRIDQLGAHGQLLLKVASVIGRVFSFDVLRAIAPEADRPIDLAQDTEELVEHDLVLPERVAPDLAWIFKHALVRDTAYNLLVFAQRRQLHRAVAEWYEQARGALAAQDYPLLAHHYALAEVPTKAREYLGLAGTQALQTGASAEAVGFFKRALALEEAGATDRETVLRRARWWRQLGLGYYALGRKGPARDAMLKAMELVGRPLARSIGGLLFQLMGQYVQQARWLIAPNSMRAAAPVERQLAAEAADAAQYVSTTYYFDKENVPFFVAGLKCASEAARAGSTAQSAVGLAYVGVLAGLFQIDRLTMTYFHRSLAIAEEVGDPSAIARHWQLRAMQRAGCGIWIHDELEDATRFFERTADRHEYEVSVTVQALIRTYFGDYSAARTLYEDLVQSARGRSIQHTVWGVYKLGELMLLEDGRHDEALPSQLEALDLLRVEAEEPTEAAVGFLVGTIRHRQGDAAAASDTIHASMQRLKDSPPNTHGMLLAYTFGIWTLLDIQDADPSPENRKRVRFAIRQMRIFTFLFPFAKARLLLFLARNALHRGKKKKADKLLARAEILGTERQMALDVALVKLIRGDADADAALEPLRASWFIAWGRAATDDGSTIA